MSVGAGPPQVSPDGKWVWDGQKWIPIPPAGAMPIAEPAPIPYISNEPAPKPVAYVYSPPEATVPAWQRQPARSGPGLYQYGAVGAVLLVLLVVILNATSIIQIPWPFAGNPTVTMVHGSPPSMLSDYDQANTFLNGALGPAIVKLANTLPPVQSSCASGATLSAACQTAINATNTEMTSVLAVIAHGGIPACIAVGMRTLQNDLQNMAGGIGVALHGFQDKSADEVNTGIDHFYIVGQSIRADATAIDSEVPTCSKVLPT
jgi:hypothetical protein